MLGDEHSTHTDWPCESIRSRWSSLISSTASNAVKALSAWDTDSIFSHATLLDRSYSSWLSASFFALIASSACCLRVDLRASGITSDASVKGIAVDPLGHEPAHGTGVITEVS